MDKIREAESRHMSELKKFFTLRESTKEQVKHASGLAKAEMSLKNTDLLDDRALEDRRQ